MTRTIVESKTRTVIIGFDQPFCVIGERINPTGRKLLAAELEAGSFATVEKDALEQVACGATMLDVNAGVVYNSNPNPNETEPPLDAADDRARARPCRRSAFHRTRASPARWRPASRPPTAARS